MPSLLPADQLVTRECHALREEVLKEVERRNEVQLPLQSLQHVLLGHYKIVVLEWRLNNLIEFLHTRVCHLEELGTHEHAYDRDELYDLLIRLSLNGRPNDAALLDLLDPRDRIVRVK